MLFLLCEVALFDPKTSQKYKTILERSWVTKNILKARNQLLCLLRNSTENTEETAKEITSAKNNLIDLIKKNYIKRDGQSNKTFRNAGVLITLATGGSLVCLSWNNKDCLKKPYIKNILAVACLGGLTLTVVSQFIHMKEKNKDLAEIEKCYHKKP
jgi:hypothetical protein